MTEQQSAALTAFATRIEASADHMEATLHLWTRIDQALAAEFGGDATDMAQLLLTTKRLRIAMADSMNLMRAFSAQAHDVGSR